MWNNKRISCFGQIRPGKTVSREEYWCHCRKLGSLDIITWPEKTALNTKGRQETEDKHGFCLWHFCFSFYLFFVPYCWYICVHWNPQDAKKTNQPLLQSIKVVSGISLLMPLLLPNKCIHVRLHIQQAVSSNERGVDRERNASLDVFTRTPPRELLYTETWQVHPFSDMSHASSLAENSQVRYRNVPSWPPIWIILFLFGGHSHRSQKWLTYCSRAPQNGLSVWEHSLSASRALPLFVFSHYYILRF